MIAPAATIMMLSTTAAIADPVECDPPDPSTVGFVRMPGYCASDYPDSPQTLLWVNGQLVDPAEADTGMSSDVVPPPEAAGCTLEVSVAMTGKPSYGSDLYSEAFVDCTGPDVTYRQARAYVQLLPSGGGYQNLGTPVSSNGCTPAILDPCEPEVALARYECTSTAWRKYRAAGRGTVVFKGDTYIWFAKDGPVAARCL